MKPTALFLSQDDSCHIEAVLLDDCGGEFLIEYSVHLPSQNYRPRLGTVVLGGWAEDHMPEIRTIGRTLYQNWRDWLEEEKHVNSNGNSL